MFQVSSDSSHPPNIAVLFNCHSEFILGKEENAFVQEDDTCDSFPWEKLKKLTKDTMLIFISGLSHFNVQE